MHESCADCRATRLFHPGRYGQRFWYRSLQATTVLAVRSLNLAAALQFLVEKDLKLIEVRLKMTSFRVSVPPQNADPSDCNREGQLFSTHILSNRLLIASQKQ